MKNPTVAIAAINNGIALMTWMKDSCNLELSNQEDVADLFIKEY